LTTHSAVVVRELSAQQLWHVGRGQAADRIVLRPLAGDAAAQGTLRACAEAYLAPSVLVCEGATEVGLIRGLDLFWTAQGARPMGSCGVAVADGSGSNMLQRALAFAKAGYRVALWHDSDKALDAGELQQLEGAGVARFFWDEPNSTEMQLFASIHDDGVLQLVELAREWNGAESVNDQIEARRPGFDVDIDLFGYTLDERMALGMAATKGKWFKTVSCAEAMGRDVVGPKLVLSNGRLVETIAAMRAWIMNEPGQGDGD
jgi:hypothetical protein